MSKYRTKTVKFPIDTDMEKLDKRLKAVAKKLKKKTPNGLMSSVILEVCNM